MRVHEAEAILKYYADIPQRIEIIRRQCAALNDEIDLLYRKGGFLCTTLLNCDILIK